jgi:phytoene dehydrogenase-like protein
MTIPSSLDPTLAPIGQHVAQIFVQYTPYDLDPNHGTWQDPSFKEKFVKRCFKIIDEFAPNFSQSVIGYDSLSPLDLERIFGIPKGNFHHLSLGIHQLAYNRPAPGFSSYRSPIKNLYMCSAGTHPGGGVMGSPGRNCSNVILSDMNVI